MIFPYFKVSLVAKKYEHDPFSSAAVLFLESNVFASFLAALHLPVPMMTSGLRSYFLSIEEHAVVI